MYLPRFLRLALVLSGASLIVSAQSTAADLAGRTDDSIRSVLRVVARHQLNQYGALADGDYAPVASVEALRAARPPRGIGWSYPWGVTLYGVIRSTDATGDTEMLNWALEHNRTVARYYAWVEQTHQKIGDTAQWREYVRDARASKIAGLLRLGNLDSCGAMGVQYLEGMLRHPGQVIPEQRAVVERIAHWIGDEQERLPDGTFWRPSAKDMNGMWPPGTIWADDLYMGCPYLVRWSAFTQNGKYLTDTAHQVVNMAQRLQDADGVWFHAYDEPLHQHSPYKWGRANGWIMVATVEILSAMPENHPDRAALLNRYRHQVDGIKKLQAPTGMWHQVLDHPELWEETSCTAMFAYAIARGVNRGWLPAGDMAVARKAFAGICAGYLTPEGGVNGTCEGTNIGMKLEFYADRKRPDDDLHGRGVVLLAGTEILNPK